MNKKDAFNLCPHCKQPVESNMKFCAHCGASLASAEPIAATDSKRQKKIFKIAVVFALVALIGLGGYYRITHSKEQTAATGNGATETSAISEEDKAMKALMAKKVLDPDNNNKVDFVVGRWLINGENLRIRKIGATEYRADDEANKKAYAITWDGTHYTLTHGKDTLIFRVKDFDNLILQDGNACGYRIEDNGQRKIRTVRNEFFEDLMSMPYGELAKKYPLESVSKEETASDAFQHQAYSASIAYGKADIGHVGPNMVGHFFRVKDTDVIIHYLYPVYDDPIRQPTDKEMENAYNNVPQDAYPAAFSGSCGSFITNMPNNMSQRAYLNIIYPKVANKMTRSSSDNTSWLSYSEGDVSYPGVSFNFDYTFTDDASEDTPVGPGSRACFYTARVSHKDAMVS